MHSVVQHNLFISVIYPFSVQILYTAIPTLWPNICFHFLPAKLLILFMVPIASCQYTWKIIVMNLAEAYLIDTASQQPV